MELILKRKHIKPDYTIGNLYIDGQFFCNTLEDTVRPLPAVCPGTSQGRPCTCKEKIYARTAIPSGLYKITLQHSPRFGRPLPLLHNVPHFTGILIHSGNTAQDSAGCILVGFNTAPGKVLRSRATSDTLNELLKGEKNITIRIE